jgi:hypothetical protein
MTPVEEYRKILCQNIRYANGEIINRIAHTSKEQPTSYRKSSCKN